MSLENFGDIDVEGLPPGPQRPVTGRAQAPVARPAGGGRIRRGADGIDLGRDAELLQHRAGELVPAAAALIHRVNDAGRALLGNLDGGAGQVARVGRVDPLVRNHGQSRHQSRAVEDAQGKAARAAVQCRGPDHERLRAGFEHLPLAHELARAVDRQRRRLVGFDVRLVLGAGKDEAGREMDDRRPDPATGDSDAVWPLPVYSVGEVGFGFGAIDGVVRGTVENKLRPPSRKQFGDRVRVVYRQFLPGHRGVRAEQADELAAQLAVGAQHDRFQSDSVSFSSSGLTAWGCCMSSAVISGSSRGRPTRYPWAASQPASTRTVSAIRSCRPSATTRSPRLCPRLTADRTIAAESGSDASAETKERSILISFTGSRISESSDE